jgi:CTP synthase
MQMACIEGARNVAGLEGAGSSEFGVQDEPVVGLITEWMSEEGLQKRAEGGDLGGTMRLGAYIARLDPDSQVARAYGETVVSERHRHRYEFNAAYRARFEGSGFRCSGTSPDGRLVEFVELEGHPFWVGTQAHPEFKSRPDRPAPLFRELIGAALERAGARAGTLDGRARLPTPERVG